ncbi:MAG: MFS transporter [Bacteroidales bacterium]|jgi:GPH family glycoside/pentoside/hexuronide:cation symporter|nr:MFS transporter [Bacteroidales bacterium]MCI2122309.1 MFS transporter [Bacteroidales bacterium]MCI2145156.1 MFS transporter [Bacteroidales bacterium]
MAEKKRPLISFREKVGYGFGDMSSSMFWKIFGMYLLFFYTDVFGLTPAEAGTMFLVTRIWDAVNDPIMGLISDRTNSRWGKYRPYLLWGAIPFALIGVLTFVTPNFNHGGKLAYAYITYTLMMMVYTLINVPYASLLGVMSPSPKDRNVLSSFRMFFAYGGSFLTFLLLQPLVDFFGGKLGWRTDVGAAASNADRISTVPAAWTISVAIIGVLCAILFFLCFKWTKERVKPVDESKNKVSVWSDLGKLVHNSPWWILLAAGVAALIFNSIRDGVAVYYFKDYVSVNAKVWRWTLPTIYLMIGQAANMLGVALAAPVANRLGKKATFAWAMFLAAVLSILFYRLKPDQVALILVFQILISVCAGSIFPLLWSMYADIVDYQELKTGRRATGLIFSSSSMSQKLGWALGSAVTGWLLGAFNYQPGLVSQAGSAVNGIRMMMSWLPAAGCIIAIIAILFYPLGENKMKDVTEQLAELRKKNDQ